MSHHGGEDCWKAFGSVVSRDSLQCPSKGKCDAGYKIGLLLLGADRGMFLAY